MRFLDRLFPSKEPEVPLSLKTSIGGAYSFALSADGSLVTAWSTYSGVLSVYASASGHEIKKIPELHEAVAWHPGGHWLAYCEKANRHTVVLVNTDTAEILQVYRFTDNDHSPWDVHKLLWSKDGSTLAGLLNSPAGRALVIWEYAHSEPRACGKSRVDWFSITPNGKRIATLDGLDLRIWDTHALELVHSWKPPERLESGYRTRTPFCSLEFSCDSSTLFVGDMCGYISRYDMLGDRPLDEAYTGPRAAISCLCKIPARDDLMAIGYGGGDIGFWNWREKRKIGADRPAHSQRCEQISVSADGKWLATCGGGVIKVWQLL